MKISYKAKSIIKKVALVLAGVAALTAVGFGVKAIVDYTKNDLKTISPKFEVGNLGADGKYVSDESTLYTKEAFGCCGLQVKPDFDRTVNYQIFYYDILDNYISSTPVMSDGYSGESPLNGAYARIVIEPIDDEDGKIGLTERVKYPSQLTVKVKKNQDINNRFTVFNGKVMQGVNDISDMVFTNKIALSDELLWYEHATICATSSTFLSVPGGSAVTADFSKVEKSAGISFNFYEFNALPSNESFLCKSENTKGFSLNKSTKFVIISVYTSDSGGWSESDMINLPSCFTITKIK